uniref:UMOD/GP2/OIT3-like D8C domain-containing protein n=1 Tax=Astyanax mexicanus TaxID=7994 RepID=A0A8B9J7N2_ASTMX
MCLFMLGINNLLAIKVFSQCSFLSADFSVLDYDPCNNYTDLDQPWRSSNAAGSGICDHYFDWDGWYRLLYYGINVRMPESCVDVNRCGTYYTLWLNGPHPEIEDGVVTRQVCGSVGFDCCYFSSTTIRVKACPGNFYVYELVKPTFCTAAYCTGTYEYIKPDHFYSDAPQHRVC